MADYIWHSGPVMVSIEALICGPLAITRKPDDPNLYTITHAATGFAIYGLMSAVKVDTKSLRAVQRFAGKLMDLYPDLNNMLQRIHNAGASPEAQKIRVEMIDAFLSDKETEDHG